MVRRLKAHMNSVLCMNKPVQQGGQQGRTGYTSICSDNFCKYSVMSHSTSVLSVNFPTLSLLLHLPFSPIPLLLLSHQILHITFHHHPIPSINNFSFLLCSSLPYFTVENISFSPTLLRHNLHRGSVWNRNRDTEYSYCHVFSGVTVDGAWLPERIY